VSHIRRFALALIAAVGLIAAAVPAASAATDTVTINSVLSPSPGQIAVSVTSTTALTELNVALTSAAHPDELSFTLADFTLESGGTDTDGTYELTSPITDAQLPFDTYTIDVTAGDSGGGSATDNAAILTWLIQPTITINASQTTFDFANPSITFSGNLSLVNPDGSAVTAADLVGQQLSLNGGETSYPVTTGTGGAYSITLNQPLGYADYSAILLATSTTAYGSSPFVYITPIQDPAEVTADVSATQLKDGQTLTVTGTADYNPGSGYVPLPNSPVQLYGGPYYDQTGPTATATTNAEGQYRFSFADHGPGTWYVYAGGVPGNSFFDQVLTQALTITKNVNVAMPVKIAGLQASLSPFAILTLKGCLATGSYGSAPDLRLAAQYATKPGGPWHTLRFVHGTTNSGTGCNAGGNFYGAPFDYQVPVVLASAYYRLAYPGSNDWLSASSKVVHESKILTRITNFAISPRSVGKNGYVTVSGRLWKYSKGWHALAKQHVWILFHYKGVWYYYLHKPLTNSSGRFSGRFQVGVTAPWIAEYMGGKPYFASATGELRVKMAGAVSARALRGLTGRPERFGGTVLAGSGLPLVA
jgi:hypothetical protein